MSKLLNLVFSLVLGLDRSVGLMVISKILDMVEDYVESTPNKVDDILVGNSIRIARWLIDHPEEIVEESDGE